MADPDKTEKATPKRREEARKEGNVASSADLSGAVVMLAGLFALGIAGPVDGPADGRRDPRRARARRRDRPGHASGRSATC